jgi:hypothetical protein
MTPSCVVESSWNVMAHGDAREGKWRGNWRMEWVASTLNTTSEHGVSSITTAYAHTPADLNGLVRFAERRNLVSVRVPSHFKRSLRTVGADVLERHYSSHLRLQVSLFLHYFNNRLPDYTALQPRRQHKSFHQAPRLSTVSITPPICHTHARSPASAVVDALLGCCEVTEFRDNISVPSSRANQSNSFWTAWPLKMGLMLSRHVGNKLPTYAA